MLDEESKAVQEVAKAAGKAVDAATSFGGFISKYLGGSLDEAMGIWEDKLKYLRWERQVRLVDRANQFLLERGLSKPTRTVSLQLAVPLLQGGSLEENDVLQDKWAALLVNAADAREPEIRRAYISIIADLTEADALILDRLHDADHVIRANELGSAEMWTYELPEKIIVGDDHNGVSQPVRHDVELSLLNLIRLGLIASQMMYGANVLCVGMTELGRSFVRACRRP